MEEDGNRRNKRGKWSTKKKDLAPRGVFKHPGGGWAVRYFCSGACKFAHKEKVGPLKSEAMRLYHERRSRAHSEPGWCPVTELKKARDRVSAERARERARVTFADYATNDYKPWAKAMHRSAATTESQITRLVKEFSESKLDQITTAQVERFLNRLSESVAAATVNRYRDRLSGMFKRAIRLGLMSANPVTVIPKLKEPGGRIIYLTERDESAVREALPAELRSLFTVSVNTGLRWSEQVGLSWSNVDLHAGMITVTRSKHGDSRHVPINSVVRSVLFDLSLSRQSTDDPAEPVFSCRHAQADKFFPRAVKLAQEALRKAELPTSGLDGYTWHGNRHTFASRLIMAGVDLRTVQELGGWKSLKMVQRYGHLAPGHLHEAVERLTPRGAEQLARN
jgi:site-specific recombinase XerD